MSPLRPRAPRRGALLLEIVMAGMLLMVAMIAAVRLLGWIADERRAAERRQWGVQAAANALERLTAEPVERLTPERLAAATLDPEAARALPDGRLAAHLTGPAPDDPPGLHRLSVEVRWRGAGGRDEAPARLHAWVRSAPREVSP